MQVVSPTDDGTTKLVDNTTSFLTQIGWKDETELMSFVQIVVDTLVRSVPPINGWTWFKFEKQVYNTVRCKSHDTVRPETEYKDVWKRLRIQFTVRALHVLLT